MSFKEASKRDVFFRILAGYFGVLVTWIIYGATGAILRLLLYPDQRFVAPALFALSVSVIYLLSVFVVFFYFKLFTGNLKTAGILALSIIFPVYMFPFYFERTIRYFFIETQKPIEFDLVYFGIILGALITGFIWGIVLYKVRR